MKKLSLLAVAAVILSVSFSSCKKCVTCTIGGVESAEYCAKKAARETWETACKAGGGTTKTK